MYAMLMKRITKPVVESWFNAYNVINITTLCLLSNNKCFPWRCMRPNLTPDVHGEQRTTTVEHGSE